MGDLVTFAIVSFSALFFVVDPFVVIPLFLTMTASDPPAKRRAMALRASVVATTTLLAFGAAGGFLFELFGITIGAFKIAGGALLFLMALDMLRAQPSRVRTSPEEEREGLARDDVAVLPLGIPMLAGPGAIATVTVLMGQARGSAARIGIVAGCVVLTGVLTLWLLRSSTWIERTLRRTGLNVLNRLMGLILGAVAVQFVVNGVADVAPQLAAALRGSG